MKKILFLSPLPPPHYGSAMSSETCLSILKSSPDFEVRNIKVNYSKSMSDVGKISLSKISGLFCVKKQIKKEIIDFGPDIIYFVPATSGFGLIRDYLFFKQARKFYAKPVLFHIRSRINDEEWNKKSARRRIFDMLKGNKAIVLGESLVSDLHSLVEKENIFVLPNAIKNEIPDREFKKIIRSREKKKNSDLPNILFLSNMDETKGWFKLLEACKILKSRGTNFKCSFVGEFPGKMEEERFESYVKSNSLEGCAVYLGKKTGDEKNLVLAESDILVFPTEYKLETFGRVILEGMMFGLPVIANGIATIPDTIIDGKTGFVLRENSPEEIEEKIESLLKNKKLRTSMGNLGRKRFLESYQLEGYSKKFISIIMKA